MCSVYVCVMCCNRYRTNNGLTLVARMGGASRNPVTCYQTFGWSYVNFTVLSQCELIMCRHAAALLASAVCAVVACSACVTRADLFATSMTPRAYTTRRSRRRQVHVRRSHAHRAGGGRPNRGQIEPGLALDLPFRAIRALVTLFLPATSRRRKAFLFLSLTR